MNHPALGFSNWGLQLIYSDINLEEHNYHLKNETAKNRIEKSHQKMWTVHSIVKNCFVNFHTWLYIPQKWKQYVNMNVDSSIM